MMDKIGIFIRLFGWACYTIPLSMVLVGSYGAVGAMLIAFSLPVAVEVILCIRKRNFVRILRKGD